MIPILGIGQDFHLSLYDDASLNLNPALTGQFNGTQRYHGHFRTQWSAVSTVPFTTGLISFDMPLQKGNVKGIGVGAQIANFNAGKGLYNVVSIMPSVSYKVNIQKYHLLSFGMQVGFFNKSLNFNRLTFENQYVLENGGGFDQGIPSGEQNNRSSVFNLDVNAGILYYFANPKSKINPFGGLTVYHINNPKESFYATGERLPVRYLAHAGTRIVLNKRWQLIPRVLYMYQRKASEFTITALANYLIPKYDLFLIGGITFRSKDATILELGAKYDKYQVRVAYDINVSDLNVSTKGRGGFEIGFTYIMPNLTPKPELICPRL
jgi:type IX secretion system PorP/SprF family membrane protein